MIEEIRMKSKTEEVDYQFIMNCLRDYRAPRDKVTKLLASGSLIRIKKGLYVFGQNWARRPYNLATLANMIYGPSYISLEYALQYYGMIPEHVHEITCMTTRRGKQFQTPVARFSYFHLPKRKYAIGFNWVSFSTYHGAFIASKEKSLADLLYKKKYKWNSDQDLEDTLFDDLRLEEEAVVNLNHLEMSKIAVAYGNATITQFSDWLQRKGKGL